MRKVSRLPRPRHHGVVGKLSEKILEPSEVTTLFARVVGPERQVFAAIPAHDAGSDQPDEWSLGVVFEVQGDERLTKVDTLTEEHGLLCLPGLGMSAPLLRLVGRDVDLPLMKLGCDSGRVAPEEVLPGTDPHSFQLRSAIGPNIEDKREIVRAECGLTDLSAFRTAAHATSADSRAHAVAPCMANSLEDVPYLLEAVCANGNLHGLPLTLRRTAFAISTKNQPTSWLAIRRGSVRLEQEPVERELELVSAPDLPVRLDFDRHQRSIDGIDAIRQSKDLQVRILEGLS